MGEGWAALSNISVLHLLFVVIESRESDFGLWPAFVLKLACPEAISEWGFSKRLWIGPHTPSTRCLWMLEIDVHIAPAGYCLTFLTAELQTAWKLFVFYLVLSLTTWPGLAFHWRQSQGRGYFSRSDFSADFCSASAPGSSGMEAMEGCLLEFATWDYNSILLQYVAVLTYYDVVWLWRLWLWLWLWQWLWLWLWLWKQLGMCIETFSQLLWPLKGSCATS